MKNPITPKLGLGSFECTITVNEGMEIETDKLGEHKKAIKQLLQKKWATFDFQDLKRTV